MTAVLEAYDNATAALIDRHITEANGDKPAFRYGGKRYTYHDAAALMNRAGNMFRKLGITPGKHILIAVAPSPAWVASVLGAMKIGAIPVLIPRVAYDKTLDAVINKLNVAVVVADADWSKSMATITGDIPVVTVGDAADPRRSFLQLLRESAASLARENVHEDTPALAVVIGHDLKLATHAQIADQHSGDSIGLGTVGGVDVEAALHAFADGNEVSFSS